jgi:DNA-directed RNA polymerase subunit M/transcription elongation factor TFIIS
MDTLDPAGEYLRISERYRRMTDEELLALIPQSSELTPFAQQALANEARSRGLKVAQEEASAANKPAASSRFAPPPAFFEHESPKLRDSADYHFPNTDSSYDEDRKLVDLCTVWSERDALQVQNILDVAGIPFFMGPEKATGVDGVTSNFANGVGVQIMQVGLPWAGPAMRHYEPQDDPDATNDEVLEEIPIRCPSCHSEDVVFDGRTAETATGVDESSAKFKWTCDACGHHWEDDGVAKEE